MTLLWTPFQIIAQSRTKLETMVIGCDNIVRLLVQSGEGVEIRLTHA